MAYGDAWLARCQMMPGAILQNLAAHAAEHVLIHTVGTVVDKLRVGACTRNCPRRRHYERVCQMQGCRAGVCVQACVCASIHGQDKRGAGLPRE